MPAEQDIGRFLKIIRRQQRVSAIILHYECLSRKLTIWYWPTNELWERVSPEGLLGFRRSRHFRAPCCLCPHTSGSYHYSECDIVIAEDGPYLGEYIATCALRSCEYIVPLDRLYARSGLRLRSYMCRCCPANHDDAGLTQHSQDRHIVTDRARYDNVQHDDIDSTIARLPSMTSSHGITEECIRMLDSAAGLTQTAVLELLAKCGHCSRIMTRRAFSNHVCTVPMNPIVIDLTSDDDSGS